MSASVSKSLGFFAECECAKRECCMNGYIWKISTLIDVIQHYFDEKNKLDPQSKSLKIIDFSPPAKHTVQIVHFDIRKLPRQLSTCHVFTLTPELNVGRRRTMLGVGDTK